MAPPQANVVGCESSGHDDKEHSSDQLWPAADRSLPSVASLNIDEQWALVWAFINFYVFVQNWLSVITSLVFWGMYYGAIQFVEVKCKHNIWYVSAALYSMRFLDALVNTISVVCTTVPTTDQFKREIMVGFGMAVIKCLIAFAQIPVAIVSMGNEGEHCTLVGIAYAVGGFFWIFWSGQEMCTWAFAYWLLQKVPESREEVIDSYMQKYVPDFLKERARRACSST